ncbi:hypothetical protein E2K80_08145 [Rhodophyticola sp. CCM32]|uniref:S24 family peptidase n=1 Tax=Rhodophyticola sp. CCM32 TaxID=2916397 RepID=UPI00107F1BE0|nr:S24 family peptidase [Rhodophyticola sp. CCM32]QBY00707.1 hypothetical protein E2K80_08145 [Rhodophyticola sp. CCM32]
MDPILDAIDQALKKKNLSDAAASRLAVGHPSLIKNFRMPRDGEKRYNVPSLQRLADVLELEFYFGPPRDAVDSSKSVTVEHALIEGESYTALPLMDADVSAGPGAESGSQEIDGLIAFRSDWLSSANISASDACIVRVRGGSMLPRLRDGDLALIDRSRRTIRNGAVYAFTDIDEQLRIKRLDRPDEKTLILHSDNPDNPSELRRGLDINRVIIHGQLVWSCQSWG